MDRLRPRGAASTSYTNTALDARRHSPNCALAWPESDIQNGGRAMETRTVKTRAGKKKQAIKLRKSQRMGQASITLYFAKMHLDFGECAQRSSKAPAPTHGASVPHVGQIANNTLFSEVASGLRCDVM
ncbi:hypothetical protein EVAR_83668_1 [Eumeta japonica]|uniref:Uncharacterized protein n=1 Tax=Eumeta variegata TaxID=151549 RepID=A0A4C1UPQ2_EUMVA|nr:hypothetical protein EVAR_83668_1 [Eumeta japonica]